MSATKASTAAALRAAQEILDAMWRAHRDGQPVHSALAMAAIIDAEIVPLVETLKVISRIGGNLPDDRMTSATGPNDARQRGLMYCQARWLALRGLSTADPAWCYSCDLPKHDCACEGEKP